MHWRNRMTYQPPQWPQRPQVAAAYYPLALTPTKKHNAPTERHKNCPKLKKKKEFEDKTGKKPQRSTYPLCDTCGKKNHPTERCCLLPKRNSNDDKNNDDSKEDENPKKTNNNNETSSSGQSTSKKPESKN